MFLIGNTDNSTKKIPVAKLMNGNDIKQLPLNVDDSKNIQGNNFILVLNNLSIYMQR